MHIFLCVQNIFNSAETRLVSTVLYQFSDRIYQPSHIFSRSRALCDFKFYKTKTNSCVKNIEQKAAAETTCSFLSKVRRIYYFLVIIAEPRIECGHITRFWHVTQENANQLKKMARLPDGTALFISAAGSRLSP